MTKIYSSTELWAAVEYGGNKDLSDNNFVKLEEYEEILIDRDRLRREANND